jgi:catechol 2,3-dioxygenase-like lactoylglutathione lyase family enzyme
MKAGPKEEVKMSPILEKITRRLTVISLMLLVGALVAVAQTPWAELKAPPSGIAPPGDVLRPGHLGRQIGETELIIHFYCDLVGLGLRGTRDQPRPFNTRHGLLEFVELGQEAGDPYGAWNRASNLIIPGTAAPGQTDMTIEVIEIKGLPSKRFNPPLSNPGASYLTLFVSDLDKTLGLLKDERFPVITVGGNPVELSSWPGLTGKIRAAFVRDPDGYPVELVQLTPPPVTTAPAGSKILGARITVVVDNLETTCRLYRSLVGPEFKFWASPSLMGDKAYENLTNTPGQFRLAMAMIPGSPVIMQFMEYKDHNKNFERGKFNDPGAAHMLFMAKDDDVIMPRIRAAKMHTLSKSNAPVFIGPTTRSFFVPDPQGFWLEFMDRDVKKDPNAK